MPAGCQNELDARLGLTGQCQALSDVMRGEDVVMSWVLGPSLPGHGRQRLFLM